MIYPIELQPGQRAEVEVRIVSDSDPSFAALRVPLPFLGDGLDTPATTIRERQHDGSIIVWQLFARVASVLRPLPQLGDIP